MSSHIIKDIEALGLSYPIGEPFASQSDRADCYLRPLLGRIMRYAVFLNIVMFGSFIFGVPILILGGFLWYFNAVIWVFWLGLGLMMTALALQVFAAWLTFYDDGIYPLLNVDVTKAQITEYTTIPTAFVSAIEAIEREIPGAVVCFRVEVKVNQKLNREWWWYFCQVDREPHERVIIGEWSEQK